MVALIAVVPPLIGVLAQVATAKSKKKAAAAAPREVTPLAKATSAVRPQTPDLRKMSIAQIATILELRRAQVIHAESFRNKEFITAPTHALPATPEPESHPVPTDSEYAHLFAESNVDRTSQLSKGPWRVGD